jgi:hypothetical protein
LEARAVHKGKPPVALSRKKAFIDAIWLSDATTHMKIFLLCVARFFDEWARGSSMSFAQVARECSMHESTAKQCAQDARDKGWLLIERGKGYPTASGPANLYHGRVPRTLRKRLAERHRNSACPNGVDETKGSPRTTPWVGGVAQDDLMGSPRTTRTQDSTHEERECSLSREKALKLPRDWVLPESWRQMTQQAYDATDKAITRSATRFRLFKGNTRRTEEQRLRDWEAWCLQEKTFSPRELGTVRSLAELPDTEWERHVKKHRADGTWHPDLGPPPDRPGCLAPPHILAANPPRRAA